ncbi:hypothetical protein BJ878DRAFT_482585 [Calycina marina]|uniref:Secreted protein n=1 Tax=Calycina marina TaxID=1763456 RepID=A0A9P8CCB2_9HELO|nr:hypothetical protein BJ878DRAFT_482585 [Calycina marina]
MMSRILGVLFSHGICGTVLVVGDGVDDWADRFGVGVTASIEDDNTQNTQNRVRGSEERPDVPQGKGLLCCCGGHPKTNKEIAPARNTHKSNVGQNEELAAVDLLVHVRAFAEAFRVTGVQGVQGASEPVGRQDSSRDRRAFFAEGRLELGFKYAVYRTCLGKSVEWLPLSLQLLSPEKVSGAANGLTRFNGLASLLTTAMNLEVSVLDLKTAFVKIHAQIFLYHISRVVAWVRGTLLKHPNQTSSPS